MEASKSEIKSIQGLSVLAMLCLHLFCRYDFSNLYTPIFYLFGYPICFYFAQISDFCVMGFAFCSGYAHYLLFETDRFYFYNRIKSLLKLIVNFWIVLILFTLISLIIGNGAEIPGSLNDFLGNLLLYNLSYNGAWWYLLTYIILVFTSIPVIKLIKKHSLIMFLVLTCIYGVSYIIRFNHPSENWFIRQAYLYGMTVFEYSIGILFRKYEVFRKASNIWNKIQGKSKYVGLAVVNLILIAAHTLITHSLIIAPVTGTIILISYHLIYDKTKPFDTLEFIGNHSTNLWLTHMFFFQYIFINLVFVAKYPILIYSLLLFITLIVSIGIKQIQKPFDLLINQIFKTK
ncbi:MAG: acyltransferase [Lachnospiraceae bacterium]